MDLRRQITIARTWLPLMVVTVLLAAGVAYGISTVQQKTFESKATLIVGQSLTAANPDYTQLLASQRLSSTYAAIATTRPILEAVISDLGLADDPDKLRERIVARAPTDSTLLTISAQDPSPAGAAAIANAVAKQLIAASPTIEGRQVDPLSSIDVDLKATQAQIATVQAKMEALAKLADRTSAQEATLATLEGRLVSLRSTYATLLSFSSGNASNLLSVIEPAVAQKDPVAPRPLLNTLIAALLGLAVAIGIMQLFVHLNDAIKDTDEVEEVSGLSTLGTITRMNGDGSRGQIYQLATLLYPRSGAAEGYRSLRANIEFAAVDNPVRTLLVTSSSPDEGKTVIACNLAVAFAQAGRRVLLVDADLRRPGVHQVFDLQNSQGLTTLLRRDEVGVDTIAQATEQDNLRVVTTGPLPPNPAELLGSQRMRAVLDRLADGSDLIVLDSPPLQAVADAAILSSFADGTLLVIDASRSKRRAVRRGREALARADAKVLGAVLNRVPALARSEYASYYGAEAGSEKQGRGPEGVPGRSTP